MAFGTRAYRRAASGTGAARQRRLDPRRSSGAAQTGAELFPPQAHSFDTATRPRASDAMIRNLKELFDTVTSRTPTGRGPGARGYPGQAGVLQKIAAAVVTLSLFAVALMFSVLLFAVVLTAGAAVWGYLWWKMRAVRRQMRDNPPGGLVIEGEVIREVRTREKRGR